MKNNFRKGFLSIAFAALAFLAAPALANAAAPANAAGNPAPEAGQISLEQQVRHQLVMLPWYSVFDNLEYQVEGSKVTLSGQVVLPILKSSAYDAVRSLRGVEEVDNQIEVLPASPFDSQIRREAYRTIFSMPQLSKYSMGVNPDIHIVVDNGHLTLEGAVLNQTDKDVAGLRANQVPNVFSVTNNLRVQE